MKVDITPSEGKVNWLVIFLVLDTDDFEDELENFFDSLGPTKLRKTTKVFFLKDTIQRIRKPSQHINFKLEISEFQFNRKLRKTRKEPVKIRGVNKKDGMAWLDAIRQIFKRTNAKYNSLITWSHGSGLGLENEDPPLKLKERKFNLIRNFKSRNMDFREIGDYEICGSLIEVENALIVERHITECTNVEQLFISDIAKGLRDVTKKKKFDLMIMCNCKAMVIDNCYNLKEVAKYYFGPMAGIQLTGYDFAGFISTINKTKENISLKKVFYHSYMQYLVNKLFTGYKKLQPRVHRGEAIIAVKLNAASRLRRIIDSISTYFMKNKNLIYPLIVKVANEKIKPLPDSVLYDAVSFLDIIKKELRNKKFNLMAERFRKLVLKQIFVDKMIGKELKEINPWLKCFTFWIPTDMSVDLSEAFECQIIQKFLRSPFVKETKWDEFLTDFIHWQNQNGLKK